MESGKSMPAIASILGPEVSSWPYSEASLVRAIELKVEQERTKQQYYKLENIVRSTDLVRIALEAQVPGHCIPLLFNNAGGEEGGKEVLECLAAACRERQSALPHVEAGPAGDAGGGAAPLNYRFPPESSSVLLNAQAAIPGELRSARTAQNIHKRTHSPARIGAAAVAALNEKSTSLKETEREHEITEDKARGAEAGKELSFSAPAPTLTKGHKRNMSLPSIQMANLNSISDDVKKPAVTVLNFGSWQSYNPQLQKTIGPQVSIKKHRRSRSASTFGVIDLNLVNQVRLPESDSRSKLKSTGSLMLGNEMRGKSLPQTNYDTDSDDQKTCSAPSTNATPMKRPNFVDNLLNS